MKNIDVMVIVDEYLANNGFDGLFNPGECSCLRGYLAPCEGIRGDCEPGYKVDCRNTDCEICDGTLWHVQREKP